MTRARQPGGDVVTTLDPAAQEAAYEGLAGRKGRGRGAWTRRPGAILALVSAPVVRPGGCCPGNGPTVTGAWRRLNDDPDKPMLNRAIRQTYPPGSTFKVVTAAAALDAGVVTDLDAPTDSPTRTGCPARRPALTNEGDGLRGRLAAGRLRVVVQHGLRQAGRGRRR